MGEPDNALINYGSFVTIPAVGGIGLVAMLLALLMYATRPENPDRRRNTE